MTKHQFYQAIKKAKTKKGYLLFAHRGVSSLAPDCSPKAISLGISMKNVDGVEFDIQETKDQKIIVYHNFYLNIDNHDHWIKDLSFSQIQEKLGKQNVTTLDKILPLFKNSNKIIDIELKSTGLCKRVIELAKKHKVYQQVVFTSIYQNLNQEVKKTDPNVARIYGYPRDRGKNLAMRPWTQVFVRIIIKIMKARLLSTLAQIIQQSDTPFISLYHKMVDRRSVEYLHQQKCFCIGATINLHNDTGSKESLATMQSMISAGADIIKTDYPQLLN